jgi:beta-lactamase class A
MACVPRFCWSLLLLVFCLPLHAQSTAKLQSTVDAIAAAHPGEVALYAEDLKTGQTLSLHAHTPVPTASIIKLTILYEALEQMRERKLSLESPVVLTKANQVPGSGVLLFFDTPLTLTLKDALSMMIIQSDNTATNMVIDKLGMAKINARIQSLGLQHTHLFGKVFQPSLGPVTPEHRKFGLGETTPREMAEVMQKLITCQLASPGHPAEPGDAKRCGFARYLLENQSDRNGIPRYLEAIDTSDHGSDIANKTGALDAVRNDVAAISTKNGIVILSIFTYDNKDQRWTADNESYLTIAKLAKVIVDAWSSQGLADWPPVSVRKGQKKQARR